MKPKKRYQIVATVRGHLQASQLTGAQPDDEELSQLRAMGLSEAGVDAVARFTAVARRKQAGDELRMSDLNKVAAALAEDIVTADLRVTQNSTVDPPRTFTDLYSGSMPDKHPVEDVDDAQGDKLASTIFRQRGY